MTRSPPVLAGLLVLALAALPGCLVAPPGLSAGPLEGLPAADALPEPTSSWLDLGQKLLAAGQPVRAEDAFIRSLRVEGMTAAAFTGAGVAVERQGLLTEAIRYFENARQLDPGSVAVHNNLGAALYGLGELEAARHAFRTAFALSSGASDVAAQNLSMTELAIARAEAGAPPVAANPRRLQRVGSTVYKLVGPPGTAANG